MEGRFRAAHERLERAIKTFRDLLPRRRLEITNAQLFSLWSLYTSGR